MATTSNDNNAGASVDPTPTTTATAANDETAAAKAVYKRYEGLMMVRTKAIKGKGAWYWAHLEPILVTHPDTTLPKAVKLRCSLCDAVFSASNPSRTASEHLKRGTCPNFASTPKPISSIPPIIDMQSSPHAPGSAPSQSTSRKRGSSRGNINNNNSNTSSVTVTVTGTSATASTSNHSMMVVPVPPPMGVIDPSRSAVDLVVPASASTSAIMYHQQLPQHPHQQHYHHHQDHHQQLVLSGGKEDLGALAMLKDSVKRLKSPKGASPGGPTLSKSQVDSALDYLSDWVYECCGSLTFSSLEHPKFKAFLGQVGLPVVSRRDFVVSRLDARYEEAKAEAEARIRDAMFFQLASDGWRASRDVSEESFVHLAVNLPNGTSVFRRAVFTSGCVPSKYAEDILWETITGICGGSVQQCVGVVSDKFKAKALRSLESQHPWMVNLCCQYQGFSSLVKDFGKELPLFKNVTENCLKLANFVNNKSQVRRSFHKYQLQEYGHAGLLRVPLRDYERLDSGSVFTLVEDILGSARALELVLVDESYKNVAMEEPIAREIEEIMRSSHFWHELEAVHSMVKVIKGLAQEIEMEKPRVGQCLPLWEELRVKVKEWCSKFQIVEGHVEKVIEKRFKKNYHPAWAAAFILDPLYLIRDTSGKYLPPFKCLTTEQEKDVDRLITRLVSREEAHIALMELMKWRTDGLDPVYAQAVQLKQRDPDTGKMKIANPQSSRLVWETYLSEFKLLGKVAVRLIFLHATSCGFKCNGPLLRWASAHANSRAGVERAQKLIFVSAHSKMEKREFSSEDDKDAELFAFENGEDDVLNDVFVDTSSVSI